MTINKLVSRQQLNNVMRKLVNGTRIYNLSIQSTYHAHFAFRRWRGRGHAFTSTVIPNLPQNQQRQFSGYFSAVTSTNSLHTCCFTTSQKRRATTIGKAKSMSSLYSSLRRKFFRTWKNDMILKTFGKTFLVLKVLTSNMFSRTEQEVSTSDNIGIGATLYVTVATLLKVVVTVKTTFHVQSVTITIMHLCVSRWQLCQTYCCIAPDIGWAPLPIEAPSNFVFKLTMVTAETLSYFAVKMAWSYLQLFTRYTQQTTGQPEIMLEIWRESL